MTPPADDIAPAPISVRRLGAADAEDYRALMLSGYLHHPEAFTSSHAERVDLPLSWWVSRIGAAGQVDEQVFGAFVDGRLVGAAGLSRHGRERERHKALLFGMVVDPACRGRGCGERLVAAVLQAARVQSGLRLVGLTVSQGNDAALRLYERAGFVCFGIEPLAVSLGEGWIGKLHMAIDLAAPQDTWLLADSEVLATEPLTPREVPATEPLPVGLQLRCSAAVVERQAPGAARLTGYLAPVSLRLTGAVELPAAVEWSACTGRLREAWLRVDGAALSRLALPFQARGAVQLELVFGNGSHLAVQGTAVSAVAGPAARFVESLAC